MSPSPRLACIALASIALSGCADPVHDDAVAALGDEDPRVAAGPLHRPGQPCLVCHDGTGPASMAMSVAGTVYQNDTDATPLVGGIVTLTDGSGRKYRTGTNCAGNFFVQGVDFAPIYPMLVAVEFGATSIEMQTHVGRSGSCATCHTGHEGPSAVPHVYLSADPMSYPETGCK